MPGRIAISLGDVTGIGPEITLKAVAAEFDADDFHYVLFGDAKLLQDLKSELGLRLSLPGPRTAIVNPLGASLPRKLSPGAPEAATAALAWLTAAARCCLDRQADALVTAPLSKEAVMRTGQKFIGQTEFLSELAGAPRTSMMLLGSDEAGRWLRVALA